jgi:hypothetical protein
VSGFLGQETGVVIQVYAVLGHGLFVTLLKSDVPMALLDPGLNGTPC